MSDSRADLISSRPIRPGWELALVLGGTLVALVLVLQPAFLAVAAAGLLLAVAAFQFDFFMYAMVVIMPWYPLLDEHLPVTDIMLILRFVMFAGIWLRFVRSRRSIPEWLWGTKLKKAVLLFAVITIASLLFSNLRTNLESYRAFRRLFGYLLVFYAMLGWLNGKDRLRNVVQASLFSLIVVALFGFAQFLSGEYTDFYMRLYPFQEGAMEPWAGRITSFLYHYNSLAGYLNLVLPFGLGAMIAARDNGLKATGFLALSLGAAALSLTGSRGGMLAAIGVLVLAAWKLVPRRVNFFWILAAVVVAVGVVLLLHQGATSAQGDTAIERLQGVDDFTQLSRFALWGAAVLMFRSNMLIGAGYGNFRYLYNDYIPAIPGGQLDAHNLYLQLLAETGLIGFLAFFLMLNGFFRRGYVLARVNDPVYQMVGIGVCGAIIAFLIHGLADFLFIVSPQFGAMFWTVLALGLYAYDDYLGKH